MAKLKCQAFLSWPSTPIPLLFIAKAHGLPANRFARSRRSRAGEAKPGNLPRQCLNAGALQAVNSLVLKLFTNQGDVLPLRGVRVESDAVQHRGRSKQLAYQTRLWLWLLAALCPAFSALGGERFNITESTNIVEIPDNKESLVPTPSFFRSQISGGESTKGPAVPPPAPPVMIPNSKLEELVDRKKNWAFGSPNDVDRNRALEESMGIRKYEMNGLEKKPKGAVERFLQGNNDRDSKASRPSNDRTNRDTDDATADALGPRRAGIIEELNPAYLFDWDIKPGSLNAMGDSMRVNTLFPRGPAAAGFGPTVPGQPLQNPNPGIGAIDRRSNTRGTPLSRINDPINDLVDPTRSVLTPITARKADPTTQDSSRSSYGESFAFGVSSPLSTRSDFFSSSQAKVYSTPAARPAAGPASAPPPQPKPMILEIPRPKF